MSFILHPSSSDLIRWHVVNSREARVRRAVFAFVGIVHENQSVVKQERNDERTIGSCTRNRGVTRAKTKRRENSALGNGVLVWSVEKRSNRTTFTRRRGRVNTKSAHTVYLPRVSRKVKRKKKTFASVLLFFFLLFFVNRLTGGNTSVRTPVTCAPETIARRKQKPNWASNDDDTVDNATRFSGRSVDERYGRQANRLNVVVEKEVAGGGTQYAQNSAAVRFCRCWPWAPVYCCVVVVRAIGVSAQLLLLALTATFARRGATADRTIELTFNNGERTRAHRLPGRCAARYHRIDYHETRCLILIFFWYPISDIVARNSCECEYSNQYSVSILKYCLFAFRRM